MRCDLRDCRLAALSLVASWLMIDLNHSITLETEHWEKMRKLRTGGRNGTRSSCFGVLATRNGACRRPIGFSDFLSMTTTSTVPYAFGQL